MGYDELIALRKNTNTKVFEEGISGLGLPEPENLYKKDLEDIQYFIDKRFRMEFLLKVEDIYDPMFKNSVSVDACWDESGNTFTSRFYRRTTDAITVVSNILNQVDFYVQSYDDMVRLHEMLYRLVRDLENTGNTLGVKNVVNPFVLDRLREHVLTMEQKDQFIISVKQDRAKVERNRVGFLKHGRLQSLNPHGYREHSNQNVVSHGGGFVRPTGLPSLNMEQGHPQQVEQHKDERDIIQILREEPGKEGRQPFLVPKELTIHEILEQPEDEYVTDGELQPKKRTKKKMNDSRIVVDF